MRTRGTVSQWDDERGFGFITPDNGGRRIFVHVGAIARGRRLTVGDVVEYTAGADGSGRSRALEVDSVGGHLPARHTRRPGLLPAVVVAALFLGVLALLAAAGLAPWAVLGVYVALSMLSSWWYASDKAAARRGAYRAPESTLHVVDLFGGWPGGLVAQQALRHKTRKRSFRVTFWGTVIANCALLALLLVIGPTLWQGLVGG